MAYVQKQEASLRTNTLQALKADMAVFGIA